MLCIYACIYYTRVLNAIYEFNVCIYEGINEMQL